MYTVPSEQPRNVYAKDKASATEIYLSWKSPPEHTIHGILRGYYIWYSIISLGIYDQTPVFPQDYKKKQLPAESKSDALTDLESYATYDIRIAAFTSKGYGPVKDISSSKRDYSLHNMSIVTMSHLLLPRTEFVGELKRNFVPYAIKLPSCDFSELGTLKMLQVKEFLRRSTGIKGKPDL